MQHTLRRHLLVSTLPNMLREVLAKDFGLLFGGVKFPSGSPNSRSFGRERLFEFPESSPLRRSAFIVFGKIILYK